MVSSVQDLPILEVSGGVDGGKDGTGIGQLVDADTLEAWVHEYLKQSGKPEMDKGVVVAAFNHGVQSEVNYPGQTFIEAEPKIRAEWSSVRGRQPWEEVRDAVWGGFDRGRNRNV
jgi:hypothetical protein